METFAQLHGKEIEPIISEAESESASSDTRSENPNAKSPIIESSCQETSSMNFKFSCDWKPLQYWLMFNEITLSSNDFEGLSLHYRNVLTAIAKLIDLVESSRRRCEEREDPSRWKKKIRSQEIEICSLQQKIHKAGDEQAALKRNLFKLQELLDQQKKKNLQEAAQATIKNKQLNQKIAQLEILNSRLEKAFVSLEKMPQLSDTSPNSRVSQHVRRKSSFAYKEITKGTRNST